MKLSVIVVSYNVLHFLEQCLLSIKRATASFDAEVFVVDNASSDGSAEMVRRKFPEVNLIANQNNLGFSKANNQAIERAKGEYVLLLNPDTVLAEDTLKKCISFLDGRKEVGGLGVRMIDGKGNFLPESKRGLPTPLVAFYKTFGLAKLFPRSKTFGRYHLGYLPQQETNEVQILSGAFMMMRKSVLDKTGLLDDTFFMYGEDIDLSYRIIKAGFKNYYYPETTIIHYKGESTKKGSLNYVRMFYNAMVIFSKKHFGNTQPGFSLLINTAIVFRGILALLASIFASSYLFLIDALLSFGGIYLIKSYWEDTIKYSEHYYPNEFLFIVVPLYIFIWISSAFLAGTYEKPFRVSKIIRGVLLGTVAIAVLYAFIPNDWRFSRAMILLGAVWTTFEMLLTRSIYNLIRHQSLSVEGEDGIRSVIIGREDSTRAEKILKSLGNAEEIIVEHDLLSAHKKAVLYEASEVVFCSRDLSYKDIIESISQWGDAYRYKILNSGSEALIGSNSKDSAGDLYVAEKSYALFKSGNLLRKRVLDVGICILLFPLIPFHFFVAKNFTGYLREWAAVLIGTKWWIGFATTQNLQKFKHARQGVFNPADVLKEFSLSEEEKAQAEINYARHYSLGRDVRLFLKNYSSLLQ